MAVGPQLDKLRTELRDPELEGWVVMPKELKLQSQEELSYPNILFSQPPPEQQQANQKAAAGFASLAVLDSAVARHDARVALLSPLMPAKAPRPQKRRKLEPVPPTQTSASEGMTKLRRWINSGN